MSIWKWSVYLCEAINAANDDIFTDDLLLSGKQLALLLPLCFSIIYHLNRIFFFKEIKHIFWVRGFCFLSYLLWFLLSRLWTMALSLTLWLKEKPQKRKQQHSQNIFIQTLDKQFIKWWCTKFLCSEQHIFTILLFFRRICVYLLSFWDRKRLRYCHGVFKSLRFFFEKKIFSKDYNNKIQTTRIHFNEANLYSKSLFRSRKGKFWKKKKRRSEV